MQAPHLTRPSHRAQVADTLRPHCFSQVEDRLADLCAARGARLIGRVRGVGKEVMSQVSVMHVWECSAGNGATRAPEVVRAGFVCISELVLTAFGLTNTLGQVYFARHGQGGSPTWLGKSGAGAGESLLGT